LIQAAARLRLGGVVSEVAGVPPLDRGVDV
jgi:hypothetical protein